VYRRSSGAAFGPLRLDDPHAAVLDEAEYALDVALDWPFQRDQQARALEAHAPVQVAGMVAQRQRGGRVARGGIDLLLPVAYDYASGRADFGRRTYNLAPTGRELVAEASYALPLLGGDLIANTWWRRDPGHIAAMPDDKGAALRFTMGF